MGSEELRERAAQHDAAAEESFQRCDTDGFVSQWAHGLEAQRLRAQAEIEANGGQAEFPGLYVDDGPPWTRVDAKKIKGRYGPVWLLSDEAAERYGRRFIPYDYSHDPDFDDRSRVQRQLGLVQRVELAPAKAVLRGSGTGLSGTAWVAVVRTDGK